MCKAALMTNWEKKKLTKQVQRTFSIWKIRLSKTPLCLESLVYADSLTQEIYCCALCSSQSWHRVSQSSAGLLPTWEASPGSPLCWEVQLGTARRDSMPRGRQNGGCWWWKDSLPPVLSSCNSTNHPKQALPSKEHHLPSFGTALWGFLTTELSS